MNTYTDFPNKALLEVMDDHGVAHEVIHEAAKRLRAALETGEAWKLNAELYGEYLKQARNERDTLATMLAELGITVIPHATP